MPDSIPIPANSKRQISIAPGVTVPEDSITLQYARSSGPGGQNVNKVNTKTELWVPVAAITGVSDAARERLIKLAGHRMTQSGTVHIAADNHRTQEANRSEAFERLRELLVEALKEPRKRKKTKPSKASRRRRIEGKKRRGVIKAGRSSRGDQS